jgi:3-deoxy-D-manno-octulosonic acid kinase
MVDCGANMPRTLESIATADGAMLADPMRFVAPSGVAPECLFDPGFWQARGELARVRRGRGAAWFVGADRGGWVLRHYRRGGALAARMSVDRYVWTGEDRVRAFEEFRLLAQLHERGLPVPEPIAARYRRGWLSYRCDLITRRIPRAEPLSELLQRGPLAAAVWQLVGATIARFHRLGVDHADLNANNILLDVDGAVSVLDFDRGRIRPLGEWRERNLRRLERSFRKVARPLPAGRFTRSDWQALLEAYRRDAATL